MLPMERIEEFLDSLPTQTSEIVNLMIVRALSCDNSKAFVGGDELRSLAISTLNQEDKSTNSVYISAVCGAIDFALLTDGPKPNIDKMKQEYEKTGDEFLNELIMRLPLAQKYFQQAKAEWKQLRAAHLSLEALREYHEDQMDQLRAKLRTPE